MNEAETICEHGTKIIIMDGGVLFDKREFWKCANLLQQDYIVNKWKKDK